jgi:hypothetical protein
MRTSFIVTLVALSSLALVGCRDLSASTEPIRGSDGVADLVDDPPAPELPCMFDRGTTTCVTITQQVDTSTHQEFSGCLAGPPPFRPGSRIRTFEDIDLVVTTTTTYQHGREGKIYDTQTSVERQRLSSREVSSVCQAL